MHETKLTELIIGETELWRFTITFSLQYYMFEILHNIKVISKHK